MADKGSAQSLDLRLTYEKLYAELRAVNDAERREQTADAAAKADLADGLARIREKYAAEYAALDRDAAQAENYLKTASYYTPSAGLAGKTAPPDFALMREIDIRIDDTRTDDPNAARLVRLCNGALEYLRQKRSAREKAEQSELLRFRQQREAARSAEAGSARAGIDKAYDRLLRDGRLARMAGELKRQFAGFYVNPSVTYDPPVPAADADVLKFGVVHRPFPVADRYAGEVERLFRPFFDPGKKRLSMPLGLVTGAPAKLRLIYPDECGDRIRRIFGGFMFNILRSRAPLPGRVFLLDPVTRNPGETGVLAPLAGDPGFIVFSRSANEDAALLKRLMDPRATEQRYLFLRGYPDYFSAEARDLIRNVTVNHAAYRVIPVSAESASAARHRDPKDVAAFTDACVVEFTPPDDTRITLPGSSEHLPFGWFTAPTALASGTAQRFAAAYRPAEKKKSIFDVCPLPQKPSYQRGLGRKGIRVPLGYDAVTGEVFSCTFDDTNAFGFLMGGAGSGKSSLLHILITGILTRYHPDDVELWLADFNRVGFMRYKTHMPPHLRYLLLDSSPLYCYGFIDKLTEEFERRQRIFSEHNWDNIADVPAGFPMPIVFVILDEFDVMSEAIKDSDEYRIRLQQIVSKGRKFGFRIVFSTQKYTTGSSGLTQTARINLNVRMAMYASDQDELVQTIGVPQLKDGEKQLIRSIRPYHVLYKQADRTQSYRLDYVENFFMGPGELDARDKWVDSLSRLMRKRTGSGGADVMTCEDKRPSVKDGITVERFGDDLAAFASGVRAYRQGFAARPSDRLVYLGKPCAFENVLPVVLTEDEYQNLLLFCDYKGSNARYLCEVMASAIRSAGLLGIPAEIWAPPKDVCLNNPQVSAYWKNVPCYTDISEIADRIHSLREKADAGTSEARIVAAFDLPRIMRQIRRQRQNGRKGGARGGSGSSGLGIDLKNPFGAKTDPVTFALSLSPQSGGTDGDADFDPAEDLAELLQWGPEAGIHLLVHAESWSALKESGCREGDFPHVAAFRMNDADALNILDNYARQARRLPEGVFMYTDRRDIRMFVPYDNADAGSPGGTGP